MTSPASKKVVYAGIASNLAIALCKYVAAAFTGSSSMLAEAFHSTVDTRERRKLTSKDADQ
jgi:divalent metal cation (Fe/Co/Zn/Cd) transporter